MKMVSFIERNDRRGSVFFVLVGALLFFVLITQFSEGVSMSSNRSGALLERVRTPLAHSLATLFWLMLFAILGVLWSRILFSKLSGSEVVVVGSALGVLALPITATFLGMLSYALKAKGLVSEEAVSGLAGAFALLGIFGLLLLGLLTLIGREVVRASYSTHRTTTV